MTLKNLIQTTIILTIILSLVSCGGGQKSEDSKSINIAYVNWAEGIAMTNLAKVILEEQGYEVELMNADVAPVFASVANGNADVFMDAWLPVTHESYMNQYGDEIETLGVNFDQARIGLVVPAYVEINSIDQMNSVKEKFDGKIVGIDAGAGIMKTTDKALEEYGLDYELQSASGPAMTATLKKEIDDDDWVVVTGWAPHWKFARYDLKFLDDPKGVYGATERIETVATKGFSEKDPFAAEFFSNFSLSNSELGDLMGAIADSKEDEALVAKQWMENNMDIVGPWIPSEE